MTKFAISQTPDSGLILGKWLLSGIESSPYEKYPEHFPNMSVLSDSVLKFEISANKVVIIEGIIGDRFKSVDTTVYYYKLINGLSNHTYMRFASELKDLDGKRKKRCIDIRIDKLSNSELTLEYSSQNSDLPFLKSSTTHYSFIKNQDSTWYTEMSFNGRWRVLNGMHGTLLLVKDTVEKLGEYVEISFEVKSDSEDRFSLIKISASKDEGVITFLERGHWVLELKSHKIIFFDEKGIAYTFQFEFSENRLTLIK